MNTKNEALEKVFQDVYLERLAQDAKWGIQNHPNGTGPDNILSEIGVTADLTREWCDEAANIGRLTWANILLEEMAEAFEETDPVKLRTELIQVIAVACGFVEKIDRTGE